MLILKQNVLINNYSTISAYIGFQMKIKKKKKKKARGGEILLITRIEPKILPPEQKYEVFLFHFGFGSSTRKANTPKANFIFI